MTKRTITDLWAEAERRLRVVDRAPPTAIAEADALLKILGPRRSDESLTDWLERGRERPAVPTDQPSAVIIPFSPRQQRFVPVAEITRLAADTAGGNLELPTRELETADGRFRLGFAVEGDQVVIRVQALGMAADEYAGRLVGIAGRDTEGVPVAVVALDEDGDGEVRTPDSEALRQALLTPVIGTIEDR